MTKKDYKLIAGALRSSRPLIGGTVYKRTQLAKQWESDVVEIAKVLANANPRFNYDKFCKECGLYS